MITENEWNTRFLAGELLAAPPLHVVRKAFGFMEQPAASPVRLLDLACGPGRHAALGASLGWQVTAVDNSTVALDQLRLEHPQVATVEADLEQGFAIAPAAWDVICCALYHQPSLWPGIQAGLRPGGIFVGVVKLQGRFAAQPGELRAAFAHWEILHSSEDVLAELIVRKPAGEDC